MEYKEKMAELKSTKKTLEDDLKATRVEINDLAMSECLKLHKVKPGSVIKEGAGGDEVKVTSVFAKEDATKQPGLKGHKKKKNGDWSKREVHVWSWNDPWALISE